MIIYLLQSIYNQIYLCCFQETKHKKQVKKEWKKRVKSNICLQCIFHVTLKGEYLWLLYTLPCVPIPAAPIFSFPLPHRENVETKQAVLIGGKRRLKLLLIHSGITGENKLRNFNSLAEL